ncbi:MAG: phosphatidylglycerol lysyltransferase domain-containing protein [Candidatus Bathyarchaeota archaeon]|nr:phosphatidylglycerol lysyltransferase domain-containing protein [Candidatus Bathyarchaeota archaeon]
MMNSLPMYPTFRQIGLQDKAFLDRAFKRWAPNISEYTFTNLFIWRETNPTLLSRMNDTILIKRFNQEMNQFHLFPPIGPTTISDLAPHLIANLHEMGVAAIYGLNLSQAQVFQARGLTLVELRENWDYVHRVQDLVELSGPKYYTKRKNIANCQDAYTLEYEPINVDIIHQCLQLQTSWCNLRQCDLIPGLAAENRATKETFLHYHELNVFGGAVYVDGSLEAFTIGERLNSNTAVIHFEKANPNIVGLYQVINQRFCAEALHDFTYVNREQDLGVPGLRRAKMSYHPTHFVEKYLVSP